MRTHFFSKAALLSFLSFTALSSSALTAGDPWDRDSSENQRATAAPAPASSSSQEVPVGDLLGEPALAPTSAANSSTAEDNQQPGSSTSEGHPAPTGVADSSTVEDLSNLGAVGGSDTSSEGHPAPTGLASEEDNQQPGPSTSNTSSGNRGPFSQEQLNGFHRGFEGASSMSLEEKQQEAARFIEKLLKGSAKSRDWGKGSQILLSFLSGSNKK